MSLIEETQQSAFILSLHICHPSQDLTFISDELGLKPFRIWKAADSRSTPTGVKLDGVYAESYCSIRFNDTRQDIDLMMENIQLALNQCIPKKCLFEDLISTGASVSLSIGWFVEGYSGETLSWELMRDIAMMKFSLEFYIYNQSDS